MYLGIEIGGTKLQLAVGRGDGSQPECVERCQIDPSRGASGILKSIERIGTSLLRRHSVNGIGVGFGGPVNASSGRVIKSHQIDGWDNYPLAEWCREKLGGITRLENDCNVAALAEARFGAGHGQSVVFYVTVGTGVGGGLAIDGQLFGTDRLAVAEIGHLRPNFQVNDPEATVESLASGWGIAATTRKIIAAHESDLTSRDVYLGGAPWIKPDDSDQGTSISPSHCRQLTELSTGDLTKLTAEMIATSALEGNSVALCSLDWAARALGWGIAQVITLLAPDVVVVGGGVSQIEPTLFLDPVCRYADQYVFPPLRQSYEIRPASLGDLVVVHGALALAQCHLL